MWSNILGHKETIAQLKRSLAKGKTAHALLFSGLEGIGKSKVALGLAQALQCPAADPPCEQCSACTKIAKGIHPDVHVIQPEGKTIRIEVLRELKQMAYLHPLEGKAKVFLIDEAETMTVAGANALLKILEEPPAHTYFILITSAPSRLLPTIRSRCRSVTFQPLCETDIAQKLIERGLTAEAAQRQARLAQGSLGLGLQFAPELFAQALQCWDRLQQNPKPSERLEMGETLTEADEKIPLLLQLLGMLAHERIRQEETKETLAGLTQQWLAIQSAAQALEAYPNKRLLLENLLFTLAP